MQEEKVLWRMPPAQAWRYCPLCGGPLADRELDGLLRRHCARCGFAYWERPLSAAAGLLVEDRRLLLVKRRYPPNEGEWALPGGGVEVGESSEEAVFREMREETGLLVRIARLVALITTPPGRTSTAFYELTRSGGQLAAGSDALEVGFFDVDKLPQLCFASHRLAVAHWLKMRAK